MPGDATVMERIVRVLEKGPLYEGAIPLVVGTTPAHARRILRVLQTRKQVERNAEGTWRLI